MKTDEQLVSEIGNRYNMLLKDNMSDTARVLLNALSIERQIEATDRQTKAIEQQTEVLRLLKDVQRNRL